MRAEAERLKTVITKRFGWVIGAAPSTSNSSNMDDAADGVDDDDDDEDGPVVVDLDAATF